MPANYTGDPTAATSPASTPSPVTDPEISEPVDGDPANADSVTQALETPNNEISWLKAPRSVASSWTQPLRQYRNARLLTGFAVDHLAFPAGKIQEWTEDWIDVGKVGKTSVGAGAWSGRWNFSLSTSAGYIEVVGPARALGSPSSEFNYQGGSALGIGIAATAPTISANFVQLVNAAACMRPWQACSMQFDVRSTSGGMPEVALGVVVNPLTPSSNASFGSLATGGAAFIFNGSDSHWQCYRQTPGGGATTDATTVTPGVLTTTGMETVDRMRIEIVGADASDDSTARVLFYVNGVLAKNVAIDLGDASLIPVFHARGGASLVGMMVGPMQWRNRMWPGDVTI